MSAKSVKGTDGKKPASAATNLVGESLTPRSYTSIEYCLTKYSWWSRRNDGGPCMPSFR